MLALTTTIVIQSSIANITEDIIVWSVSKQSGLRTSTTKTQKENKYEQINNNNGYANLLWCCCSVVTNTTTDRGTANYNFFARSFSIMISSAQSLKANPKAKQIPTFTL